MIAAAGHVYFVYLVFIDSVTMVPLDPFVQSGCTKEQPCARANYNLLQKSLVTRGGHNKLLVADSRLNKVMLCYGEDYY